MPDASLADSTARLYWQCCLIFIKYVDTWFGIPEDGRSHHHSTTEEYFQLLPTSAISSTNTRQKRRQSISVFPSEIGSVQTLLFIVGSF